ncbi:hypothetical protein DIS24_g4435 [Lasiodiplodia hormozganensis]|uniref:GPI anchored protein n=1 Tax=Lasiodiplodia hormozganensis TaxID=869390 RepID=A0AA39YWD6_9PEZI|nr:hypothetical protein DIS24_g4435 [Lasiodiplodia hormozganensis]
MKAAFLLAGCALVQRALSSPLVENALLVARDDDDDDRNSCGPNLEVCSPSGASTDKLPALGPDLSGLYLSLLDAVKGINFKRDSINHHMNRPRDDTPSFCCATGTSCLLLSAYDIPFCYDKFTTNFIFPDGSSGTIHTGAFSSSSSASGGGTANLLNGTYTTDDTTDGDLYAGSNSADRPNTASLSIPPQYTATGVGSAIPLTALGVITTVVVTAVTTEVSTVSESVVVVPASTRPESTVLGTTIAGETTRADSVVPATTIPARTTTVAAHETRVTVSSSTTSVASAAAASASQTGGAVAVGGGKGMGVMGGAAVLAVLGVL